MIKMGRLYEGIPQDKDKEDITSIQLTYGTKEFLNSLKADEDETFDATINRIGGRD